MGLILLRDLQYRKWRVLLTVMLMAIVMTLLFIMAGLVGQFNAEPELATRFAGDDKYWVVPAGAGGPITNPQAVPRPLLPPVPDGEAVLFQPSQLDGERVFVAGRDFKGPNHVEKNLDEGRMPAGPGEVVVDATTGLRLGESARLGTETVTVVGLVDDATVLAGVPMVFAPIDFAQQAVAGGNDVAMAIITDDPDPNLPPEFQVLSSEQVTSDTLKPLENAISSVTLVQALLWLITTIVIAAIVYITALERTRDFAVLKAVGGKTRDLASSLLVQGVIMTALAVGIAAILQSFVAPAFPMIVRVPSSSWWQIPVGAVVVAAVAGMAGVMKVRATSPSEAFG
jgi:putative ABC transport system permease protein